MKSGMEIALFNGDGVEVSGALRSVSKIIDEREENHMIQLKNEPYVRLSDGTFIPASDYRGCMEAARSHTMAWKILKAHNEGGDMENLHLRFDMLVSPDDNYTSILQELCAVGERPLDIPWILTNCHNTLAATGGTINNDDHAYGLGCMKKLGGIFVPPYTAVIHQYIRECRAGGGSMILGSDSHTRYGCLGTMGIGEGGTEIARQALGSTYDIRRPPVIALHLSGTPVPGVGPMDVGLTLIGAAFDCGFCKNKILEVVGKGIGNLSMEYRMGIDVMTTESAALSSIWMTDETTREWLAIHGREEAYEKLEPAGDALYDGLIEIDLGSVEPMIALPFHPSNVFSIRELCSGRPYLDGVLASVEADAFTRSGLRYTLRDKVQDKRLTFQQASIAGCAGGMFENIAAAADILDGYRMAGDGISLGIYPASQPIFLETMRQGVAERLTVSGATMRPCICGPCFGTVDVPANNTLAVRHVPRNYYSREGSKTGSGQLSATALMDARSIAATVRNKGRLTAATEMDAVYNKYDYHFDKAIYKGGIYDGFGCPQPYAHVPKGPNIKDWPDFPGMKRHVLLKAAACFEGSVTTDELCPSGEASSLRSNPEKIAGYTLVSKDREYVDYARSIRDAPDRGEPETCSVLEQVCAMLGAALEDITYGSLLISDRIGDGSSREQAASNQKVLGGWANLAKEYSTKRYRSNCISWGLIPLTCRERPDLKKGDYLLLPDASEKIRMGREELEGIILKTGERIRLSIGEMTVEERKMLVLGSMINYYRSIRQP